MSDIKKIIEEIDELEKKATSGPWDVDVDHIYHEEDCNTGLCKHVAGAIPSPIDCKLIAALRNSWPAIKEAFVKYEYDVGCLSELNHELSDKVEKYEKALRKIAYGVQNPDNIKNDREIAKEALEEE